LKKKWEVVVEKNQKQQQYHDRNERSNADTTPVFRGGHETEEIAPGVPIIRSNTPRPSSFDTMLSSTEYIQKFQRNGSAEIETVGSFEAGRREVGEGELPHGFPVNASSAPPLSGELKGNVNEGKNRPQFLGLAFTDARTGAAVGAVPSESLPAFKDNRLSSTRRVMAQERSQPWLIAFSLYLAGLLLVLLLLAVLEGTGVAQDTLPSSFAPLGVPWQVLIYGLLGGCISCIVSLSNVRVYNAPLFVIITWFTRPFIGSILALFSYLLLTSGLFMLGETLNRHPGFFWLVGSMAGLCEWWFFCRRKGPNP
jgi:hypothetical protein